MGKKATSRKTRRRPRINLSACIREYLAGKPDAKPAEIVDYLYADHGARVSPQYVSTIKSNTKRRQQHLMSSDPALQRLQLAKEFCQQMGGVEEAQRAIRDWATLTQ